ncbi:MAG: exodeoxyribonuclease VII large subunit [Ruminococcus sp.]|nr:exodeoxyribonuclease VII large subunit [Ruminococcus sp.]
MSSILTVSQLNKYIGFKIKSDTKLKGIAVKGELSDLSVNYRSGHMYFSLKDETSLVKCVMFSSNAAKLRFDPENGMSVLAIGNIDVYERGGVYQINTSELQPLGAGAARLGLEQLKRKLADAGVFDPSVKKKIPLAPKKLAIVTSPTGAALQDILNILGRRYPIVKVEVYSALVQGDKAPESICTALKRADASGADTLILARGGGSDDDLSAFNTEAVTLAVFDCKTPIISAVGHEIDTFLCDYAADLRAPTPSAAAELAVPEMADMLGAVEIIKQRLGSALKAHIENEASVLNELGTALKLASPITAVESGLLKTQRLTEKLSAAAFSRTEREGLRLDKLAAQLSDLSPFNILERGYAITSKEGRAVSSADKLSEGDRIEIRFSDGKAEATVTRVMNNEL